MIKDTLPFFSYAGLFPIVGGIFSRPAFERAVEIGQVAVTQFRGNLLHRIICRLQQIQSLLIPDDIRNFPAECFFGGSTDPACSL